MKKSTTPGKAVRSKRLEMGISQNKLAKELGITRQAISNFERGETICRCKTKGVLKICEFFGINLKDFKIFQPKRKIKKVKSKTALGRLLIKRRRELRLSRNGLCQIAGLCTATLYLLEKGRTTKLSPRFLYALEETLGCKIPEEYISIPRKYLKIYNEVSPLGELVFKLRKEQGLTRKHLCEISRVSMTSIWRIESGQNVNFHLRIIRKIFRALNAEFPKELISRK